VNDNKQCHDGFSQGRKRHPEKKKIAKEKDKKRKYIFKASRRTASRVALPRLQPSESIFLCKQK